MKGIFNLLLNLAKKNPYPVGSIYMSVNATDPSTLFGGTWERIKDTFLLSAGDTYANGSTGGEATHTLTVDEIPNHHHNYTPRYNWGATTKNVLKAGSTMVTAQTNAGTGYASIDTDIDRNRGTTYVGGGQSHNNLPPYLAVYVWKRTA